MLSLFLLLLFPFFSVLFKKLLQAFLLLPLLAEKAFRPGYANRARYLKLIAGNDSILVASTLPLYKHQKKHFEISCFLFILIFPRLCLRKLFSVIFLFQDAETI